MTFIESITKFEEGLNFGIIYLLSSSYVKIKLTWSKSIKSKIDMHSAVPVLTKYWTNEEYAHYAVFFNWHEQRTCVLGTTVGTMLYRCCFVLWDYIML